ncbi:hypothetical protein [Nocardioides aurantiacus]|uniref:hypothetical protein n=1 Tax=Nocardioides aurantiacus TaxID=86796 RepID=UPI0011CDAA0A|nr:hypothetical protein [Nocardioides aurantiacus]
MELVGDPAPLSQLALLNADYPYELASDWVRGYLDAALEHLLYWANVTAPLVVHADEPVDHDFRPVQTLSRAAVESAAQAVWILGGNSREEAARRHLCLIRWDISEQRKSLPVEHKHKMTAVDDALLARVSARWTAEQLRPPTYLDVIRSSCRTIKRDPAEAEALWRASAGSAHGKRWPSLALRNYTVGEEYQPGQHRTQAIPDPEAMTAVLKLADGFVTWGVQKFLEWSGADYPTVHAQVHEWLAGIIPLKEESQRGELVSENPFASRDEAPS